MPDAVMVDSNMPVMDGLELIRALRGMNGGRSPKVIFCLTEYNLADVARAKRAGADIYLLKPFDKELIEEKLREIGLL